MSNPPLLDWRDRKHWAWAEAPCQHCHKPTHLRDDDKKPAHKVCAEAEAARVHARAAARYENEGNFR